MARLDANLTKALKAVRLALDENISEANRPNCFIALDPLQQPMGRAGDFYYVVSPFDGQFDSGNIDGGGQNQVTTDAQIAITIHSTQNLDRAGEDNDFLYHCDLGLIERFENVLRIFTARDLLDTDGDQITYEPIIPTSYNIGRERAQRPTGWMQLVMTVKFDWDLSG